MPAPSHRLGHATCAQCYTEHPIVYEPFPKCTNCGDVVCPACAEPGSIREDEGRLWCRCLECLAVDADAYVRRLQRAFRR